MNADKLVRLLPTGQSGMFGKRPRWDYRNICDCQKHAGRRRLRRVAAAVARHLTRRSVALLIGVPLAFGALGLPMEAMNITLPELADRITEQTLSARELPIFTTRKVRKTFLTPLQSGRKRRCGHTVSPISDGPLRRPEQGAGRVQRGRRERRALRRRAPIPGDRRLPTARL